MINPNSNIFQWRQGQNSPPGTTYYKFAIIAPQPDAQGTIVLEGVIFEQEKEVVQPEKEVFVQTEIEATYPIPGLEEQDAEKEAIYPTPVAQLRASGLRRLLGHLYGLEVPLAL